MTDAGWYPDPGDSTKFRYFDGAEWTEHTAPAVASTDPYRGTVAAGYAPVQVGPSKTLSVISMVLSLSSIIGLLVALLGVPLAVAGLVTGLVARRREPHAKSFWMTGIVVGAIVTALLLVFVVIAGVFMVIGIASR